VQKIYISGKGVDIVGFFSRFFNKKETDELSVYSPPSTLEGCVDELIKFYKTTPRGEGFVVSNYTRELICVKEIGEQLADMGGFELMLQAHQMFSDSYQVYGAARNLEYCWDGVGEWRG
jgi:hypothetical protein